VAPRWFRSPPFDEKSISMSVSKEDLHEVSFLFDLDEWKTVLLLFLSWEGEDVVEDGGGRSKVEGSSREIKRIPLDDSTTRSVSLETGKIGE